MQKQILMVLMAVLIGFTACKKDEEPEVKQPTKKELLCKMWKIQEYYEDGQLNSDPIYTAIRFSFKTDGTYNVVFMGQDNPGIWEFNSDETKIILDKGTPDEVTLEILKLDASHLNMKSQDGADSEEYHMIPA